MPPMSHPKNFGRGKPAPAVSKQAQLEVRLRTLNRIIDSYRAERRKVEAELDLLKR